MPPEDRVGRDDHGHLTQPSTSQPVPAHGESSYILPATETPSPKPMPRAELTMMLRETSVSRLPVQKWMPCSESPVEH